MSNNVNGWSIGLLLRSPLYVLPVLWVPGNSVWAANDTIVADGTERSIANLTLENETNGTFIVQAKNGASFTVTDMILNTSGINGGGTWVEGSKLTAENVKINVTGRSGTGVHLANTSEASLNAVTIQGENNTMGLVLDGTWSTPQGKSTAQVNESTITTASGDAIRVMDGDLTLTNVTASTSGDSSYAVNANYGANVAIEGGEFSTKGTYSDAVWVASEDSSATMKNVNVVTGGNRSSAVNAQKGAVDVTDSTLETKGENAYGIYTEKRIQGDALTITTSGVGGAGVMVALGGVGSLTNSTIATSGELAPGLLAYPASEITADNVQIDTTGKEGSGLWSRGGTLNVGNSNVTTSGEAASGLYINGYSSTAAITSNVSLDNVTLKSKQAQAIEVSTANAVLNVKDSEISGGNDLLMSVSHTQDSIDEAYNVYSDVTFNATNSTLNGDIAVSDVRNTVAVGLTSGTVLNGAVTNATSLAIDNSSSWNMNNSSVVDQLNNNGKIVFSDQSKFDTLTVTGNYAGDGGELVMNSVLGFDDSSTNKLIVGGDVLEGTTKVTVNNLGGQGSATVEGIQIVDVSGTSQGEFVKAGRIVAGAYDYNLVKKDESWYLTSSVADDEEMADVPAGVNPAPGSDVNPVPDLDVKPTPKRPPSVRPEAGSYIANLAAANTMFIMSLDDRLGETQFIDALTGQPEVTSLWLRQIGGHNVWHDGSGQLKTQSNRYVAQMGIDFASWSLNNADRWHLGVMGSYGNNHSNTRNRLVDYRSKGSVSGYSVGGYATWYANDEKHIGGYLDSWVQYNWFNNEVSGENQVTETYKSHGFTASLEGGYTWKLGEFHGSHGALNEWFIQPQAQAIWMGVRADELQEANNTHVKGEGDGNLQTRLGVKTFLKGHHTMDNGKQREFQPYLELNWLHNTREFATKMDDVRISQNGVKNLGEVKVGVEGQINPRLNLWGNIGVQMGDAGYNDSAAMFGVKYNF